MSLDHPDHFGSGYRPGGSSLPCSGPRCWAAQPQSIRFPRCSRERSGCCDRSTSRLLRITPAPSRSPCPSRRRSPLRPSRVRPCARRRCTSPQDRSDLRANTSSRGPGTLGGGARAARVGLQLDSFTPVRARAAERPCCSASGRRRSAVEPASCRSRAPWDSNNFELGLDPINCGAVPVCSLPAVAFRRPLMVAL